MNVAQSIPIDLAGFDPKYAIMIQIWFDLTRNKEILYMTKKHRFICV